MILPYVIALTVAKLAVAEAKADKVKPQIADYVTGADSKAEQFDVQLVRSNDQWINVWQTHRSRAVLGRPGGVTQADETVDMPRVDFTQFMVLALFGGEVPNVNGYEIDSVGTKDHKCFVNLRAVYGGAPNTTIRTLPYIFIKMNVLPRALDVRLLRFSPDAPNGTWVKIKSFPKPDDGE